MGSIKESGFRKPLREQTCRPIANLPLGPKASRRRARAPHASDCDHVTRARILALARNCEPERLTLLYSASTRPTVLATPHFNQKGAVLICLERQDCS